MKKLILTPELAAAIKKFRLEDKLNYAQGAEKLGVAHTVYGRWCRELNLNAPIGIGRPRTSSPERRRELQNLWKRNHYKAKRDAAD